MKKELTRKEKIKLLKDFESGRVTISELKDEGYNVWIERSGIYSPAGNASIQLTKEQFEAHCTTHPSMKRITVIILPHNNR